MNEQQQFWSKEYAEEYIKKNASFDSRLGVEAWSKMLSKADGINQLLECGCNIGRNIGFLEELLPSAEKSIIEISQPAFDFVTAKHTFAHKFRGSIIDSDFSPESFDLVYSMGVLIHIHPDDLLANVAKMYNYSRRYICIGEYFNRTPVMLSYQGQENKLFKRDFGRFVIENFNVEVVDYGFLWGHYYDAAGFDDITWWLFRKMD